MLGRDIGQEALVIEGNLQKIRIVDGTGHNAHIHFGLPQLVLDGDREHLFRLQGNGRVVLPEVFEEAGYQHRRHGGDERYVQRPGQHFLFRPCHFGNLFYLIEDHLGVVDDFPADFRRGDGMRVAIEQAHIQFLFQLFDHQAQGRLGKVAGLCGLAKMPVFVDGYDIAQLLKCHVFD